MVNVNSMSETSGRNNFESVKAVEQLDYSVGKCESSGDANVDDAENKYNQIFDEYKTATGEEEKEALAVELGEAAINVLEAIEDSDFLDGRKESFIRQLRASLEGLFGSGSDELSEFEDALDAFDVDSAVAINALDAVDELEEKRENYEELKSNPNADLNAAEEDYQEALESAVLALYAFSDELEGSNEYVENLLSEIKEEYNPALKTAREEYEELLVNPDVEDGELEHAKDNYRDELLSAIQNLEKLKDSYNYLGRYGQEESINSFREDLATELENLNKVDLDSEPSG